MKELTLGGAEGTYFAREATGKELKGGGLAIWLCSVLLPAATKQLGKN